MAFRRGTLEFSSSIVYLEYYIFLVVRGKDIKICIKIFQTFYI